METLQKHVDLYFTTLEFYDFYVLSSIKEDAVLGPMEVNEIIAACNVFFGNKEFVYISKREKEYNVVPTIYLDLNKKITNLSGIAIVTNRKSMINSAKFERNFSKVPFEVFLDLEKAIAWAKKQVEK